MDVLRVAAAVYPNPRANRCCFMLRSPCEGQHCTSLTSDTGRKAASTPSADTVKSDKWNERHVRLTPPSLPSSDDEDSEPIASPAVSQAPTSSL